jgi:hypothetical protein
VTNLLYNGLGFLEHAWQNLSWSIIQWAKYSTLVNLILYREESLLKPLLTYYDQCYGGKKLCEVTLEATFNPHSGLKNGMQR